jgi:hypothetical protein
MPAGRADTPDCHMNHDVGAVRGLCSFAFRALVSSCSAVCPLCWLPRRLVYVRHVRILDSKRNHDVGLLVLLAAATCNALAVLVLELQSEKLGRVRLSACGQ